MPWAGTWLTPAQGVGQMQWSLCVCGGYLSATSFGRPGSILVIRERRWRLGAEWCQQRGGNWVESGYILKVDPRRCADVMGDSSIPPPPPHHLISYTKCDFFKPGSYFYLIFPGPRKLMFIIYLLSNRTI